MRHRTLAVLLPLAGALAGCDSLTGPGVQPGTFVGTWDGAGWRGDAHAVLHADTLYVYAHRPDPTAFYDEFVEVRAPFQGPGSYAIPESDGQLKKVVGGDAGYLPRAAGTLVISAYDPGSRTIAGEITLTAHHADEVWEVSGAFATTLLSSFAEIPWRTR